MRARRCALVLAVALLLLAVAPPATAAPAEVDRSFGILGMSAPLMSGTAIARTPDGGYVVSVMLTPLNVGIPGHFLLIKLNALGLPDVLFGTAGLALIKFGTSGSARPTDLAVMPDGRILVAGYAPGGLGVARLSAGGALDRSFGTLGKTVVPMTVGPGRPSVTFHPDGLVYLAAAEASPSAGFLVARLTQNGALDAGFRSTGVRRIAYGGTATELHDLLVLPDGRPVIGGANRLGGDADGVIIRLTQGGANDATFGGGTGRILLPDMLGVSALALQGTSLLAAQWKASQSLGDGHESFIGRYLPDGTVDSSFGTAGLVDLTVPVGNTHDHLDRLLVRADGSIVGVGDYRSSEISTSCDSFPGDCPRSFSVLVAEVSADGSASTTSRPLPRQADDAVFGPGNALVVAGRLGGINDPIGNGEPIGDLWGAAGLRL